MEIMELTALLLIIGLPIIAQIKVKSAYNKYAKVENSSHLTGASVARQILDRNGLSNVTIGKISGSLTDHYDPRQKHINLSESIYEDSSISSIAVAAHECGHAIQDKEAYSFLRFRSSMVPVVNFTSRIASIFLVIGFVSEFMGLVYVGIALLCVGLLFQLVTLPVEFDASNRAKKQLQECGLVETQDVKGTNKVLGAAALTYVASFLAMALQVVRLLIISRNRR